MEPCPLSSGVRLQGCPPGLCAWAEPWRAGPRATVAHRRPIPLCWLLALIPLQPPSWGPAFTEGVNQMETMIWSCVCRLW